MERCAATVDPSDDVTPKFPPVLPFGCVDRLDEASVVLEKVKYVKGREGVVREVPAEAGERFSTPLMSTELRARGRPGTETVLLTFF